MASRSEREIMQLIMDVAANNQDIRAVLLNGSRADPNVTKDIFQDYDIIYAVRDLSPFVQDHSWIDIFGERMILQMPEDIGALSADS
jgi:aminoglycoside 6-adenylyltransferase